MLYFDHAASTPMEPEALKVLAASMQDDFANPASAHKLGKNIFKKINTARTSFLNWLGADTKADELLFCSSATEANNQIINHFWQLGQGALFVAKFDHPSLVKPCYQSDKQDCDVFDMSACFYPQFDGGKLEQMVLQKKPKLLVLAQVNNLSGTHWPLQVIGEMLAKYGVHFHVDASQSFTKCEIDVKRAHISSLSISAHKMGGPRGIAALYFKSNLSLTPLLRGGDHESGVRASTVCAPLIFAFKTAAEIRLKAKDDLNLLWSQQQALLVQGIKDICSEATFPFIGNKVVVSPAILFVIIPKISSDILMRFLEEKDIYVSSNSACSSKSKPNTDVFASFALDPSAFKSVLRISFGATTTQADCDQFIIDFKMIYKDLSCLI